MVLELDLILLCVAVGFFSGWLAYQTFKQWTEKKANSGVIWSIILTIPVLILFLSFAYSAAVQKWALNDVIQQETVNRIQNEYCCYQKGESNVCMPLGWSNQSKPSNLSKLFNITTNSP